MLTTKERIEALCAERGMTISALEKEIGLGSGTILKWDHRKGPSADKLSRVADYFHVSVDYLLGREVDEAERDALAEQLARDPEYRAFMDMARFCSTEELEILKGMIRSWKKKS